MINIVIPQLAISIFHDIIQCLETIKYVGKINPIFWNPQYKSLLDMFDEIKPNIVFVHESQLDSAFQIACDQFQFKYVLMSMNPLPDNLHKQPEAILSYPTLNNSFQNYKVISIVPSARIAQIHAAQYNKNLECDVLIDISNVELTSEITTLLLFLANTYKIKIIGNTAIKIHQYIGRVNFKERADLIKSAKVVLDLNQNDFWDASYLKVPAICAQPTEPYMLRFDNLNSLKHNIDILLNNTLVRSKYIQDSYDKTMQSHTYFHVCAEIFDTIDEHELKQHCLQYIEDLIQ